MNSETILLSEIINAGVLRLTLNRPEKLNALNTPLLTEIAEACSAADKDNSIRVIIITGSEKVFAAGADINEIKPKESPEGLADPRVPLWTKIRATRKPIVAAVEGWCLGAGNELLMCTDIAIAGKKAKFGQPETNLGIIPGAGGAATLPRLVGRAQAMKMVLLGKAITADEAQSYGLIADVVETGEALTVATEYAQTIASRAPLALQEAKAVVKASYDMPHSANLLLERQAFSLLFSTKDKNEGIDAFLNKRKPEWSGS